MYSSSYKHRSATLNAFEDAYAKEQFLKRSASGIRKPHFLASGKKSRKRSYAKK